jgi:predicted PurR-regulated permease PerM
VEFDIINWTWEWIPAVIFGAPLVISTFISIIFMPMAYFYTLREMYRPLGRLRNVFRRK